MLGACASVAHDAVSAVDVHRIEDVRLMVEPQVAGLAAADEVWDAAMSETPGPVHTLQLNMFLVRPESLAEALGERDTGLVGVTCSRVQAQRLCEELRRAGADQDTVPASRSKLSLHDGQRGYIAVKQEQAYIAGFELVRSGDQAIADPRVEVAQGGALLCAKMQGGAEGALAIDLELTLCELDRPFATRSIELLRGCAPVAVQIPTGISRKLAMHSDLARDEALVFGGTSLHVAPDGRVLVAVLEIDSEASAAAPARAP
jgi:hypothetical protein